MAYPTIQLMAKRDGRARAGHPWIYSNELDLGADVKSALRGLEAGSPVTVISSEGNILGTYSYNPRTLIALRKLSGQADAPLNAKWFAERLRHAVRRRERMFDSAHYRLVHSEGDDLPGLVVDRFGPTLVAQVSTAGMALLKGPLEEALLEMEGVKGIIWRQDGGGRELEGLKVASGVEVSGTVADGLLEAQENGLVFAADGRGGQKTGWFYDQRANRAFVAGLAKGQSVLDVCCHTGGFGLTALSRGAEKALFVDASEAALELAAESARRQKMADKSTMMAGDMFEALEHLAGENQRFGVVVCDPPAFIKSAKAIPQGLKGYEKMAKLSAAVTSGGGYLTLCSCSHNAEVEAFVDASVRGMRRAGRSGRIVRLGFADTDHPQHLLLAENGYLKCLTVQLD